MPKGSVRWRLGMVCIGCIQNFLMGGVIFGWAAISNTMLVSTDGAPGLRASHIHEMFVMASSANMCSPLFLGVVLDKLGPRACSAVSIAFSCAGFALFGLAGVLYGADAEDGAASSGLGGEAEAQAIATRERLFTLSVVFIGFGGPGVQNAVIHLANLFPAKKGLVTAIITGCFQLSFCIFFIFDQLWFFAGVDYRTIFIVHACVCLVCLATSLLLWPDRPFQFDEEVRRASPNTRRALGPAAVAYSTLSTPPPPFAGSSASAAHSCCGGGGGCGGTMPPPMRSGASSNMGLIRYPSVFKKPTPAEEAAAREAATAAAAAASLAQQGSDGAPPVAPPSTQRQFQASSPLLKHTPSSSSSSLPRARSELKNASLGRQLVSEEFLSATVLLTVASFWANFYIGAVDLQLADEAYMNPHDQAAAMRSFTMITVLGVLGIPFVGYSMDHLGFRKTLIITVTLGVVWSGMTLFHDKTVLMLSFAVYALFRTFTFNYYFAFIADRLGFRFFGVLAGVSFCVAGLVGLFGQAPLLNYGHGPCVLQSSGQEVSGAACIGNQWYTVNLVKLGTMACLYVMPLRRRLYAIGGAIQRSLSGSILASSPGGSAVGSRGGSDPNLMMPPRGGSYNPSFDLVSAQRSAQLGVTAAV